MVTLNVVAGVLLPVLVDTGAAMMSLVLLYDNHACSMCSVGRSWNLKYVHSRPCSNFSLSLLETCRFARSSRWKLLNLMYV
jgi:hypothetical protein